MSIGDYRPNKLKKQKFKGETTMKKLALVLGSLLVVGSVASAKEVMPAPTPAPEKVVEYVEKPVIVYRDREVTPAWRPNGSVDVQYRWYGEVENKTPKKDTDGDWVPDKKVNAGEKLTWDDVKDLKWSVMNPTSPAGYIYPTLWLNENFGKTIKDYGKGKSGRN